MPSDISSILSRSMATLASTLPSKYTDISSIFIPLPAPTPNEKPQKEASDHNPSPVEYDLFSIVPKMEQNTSKLDSISKPKENPVKPEVTAKTFSECFGSSVANGTIERQKPIQQPEPRLDQVAKKPKFQQDPKPKVSQRETRPVNAPTRRVNGRPKYPEKVAKQKPKGGRGAGNIILPTPKPSTHPLFPVWQAYDQAYQDRSLHNRVKYTTSDRLDIIIARTIAAARQAGLVVNHFNKDLYPLLQPWIVACGEPKGAAMWRANLVQAARALVHLPFEQAAQELRDRAMKDGLPLGQRQSEELIFQVQGDDKD